MFAGWWKISGELEIPTPRWAVPFLKPARYKGLKGGRGSGKSHFFAELLVEAAICNQDIRAVGIREIQKSLKYSSKQLIEDKIVKLGAGPYFDIQESEIKCRRGDGIIIFQGMQDHTADSIKSLEGFDIAWVEEAQNLSERSLRLLRPTIRKPNSELWFSWNPDQPEDAVDAFLCGSKRPTDAVIAHINYTDNPFLPETLRLEMEHDRLTDPDNFGHVWLGEYRQAVSGAVYGKEIAKAYADERVCHVPYDQAKPVHTFWDLGWGDYTSIWFYQYVGKEHRLIDFQQYRLTTLAEIAKELANLPYIYGSHNLPHDGEHKTLAAGGKSIAMQLKELVGRNVRVLTVPNIGFEPGKNLLRNQLGTCWFDAERCADGLKALRNYRYNDDADKNKTGRLPMHDNNSHAADALRYLAVGWQNAERSLNPHIRRTGTNSEQSWLDY